MVVRFSNQQDRGQAGQSAMSGKNRNFANLYNMNRSGDQTMEQVNKIGNQVTKAQGDVDRLGNQAAQAARRGLGGQKQPMNQMASAVQSARSGSIAANQYDPSVKMMQSGASPFQAGVGSFYSGGKAAKQSARRFGNTFNEVQNTARSWQQRIPGMAAQGALDKANRDRLAAGSQTDRKNKLFQQSQSAYRYSLQDPSKNPAGRMDNLTWLLRTGRISAQQMYAAQKDQALYNDLMNTYGNPGYAPAGGVTSSGNGRGR